LLQIAESITFEHKVLKMQQKAVQFAQIEKAAKHCLQSHQQKIYSNRKFSTFIIVRKSDCMLFVVIYVTHYQNKHTIRVGNGILFRKSSVE
jgi:hypothetical protein